MWRKSVFLFSAAILSLNAAVISQPLLRPEDQSDSLLIRTRASEEQLDSGVRPPTPKASSMLRYGECPVSLYTGLVDITVPIYSLQRCGVTIPIELKYHASGIKYDDVSQEAGLGWTLIAGGVITQSARGTREEGGKYTTKIREAEKIGVCQHASSDWDKSDYTYICNIASGAAGKLLPEASALLDGEIDIYSFSFLNRSGSFCFPPTDSEVYGSAPYTGVFIPSDGMQVVDRNDPNSMLKLLDTDGVEYTFKAIDNKINDGCTEFYLTKILSADKADKVTFVYTTFGESATPINRPYINFSVLKQETDNSSSPEYTPNGGVFSHDQRPPRLDRIEFRGGHIDFVYHPQDSISLWNLQKIEIYNSIQRTPLQTVTLSKTLFDKNDMSRQRLDKVTFSDSQGHSYNYQFGYNGTPGLNYVAGRRCFGIDYWGYYNSTSGMQQYFIPRFDVLTPHDRLYLYTADRSADENAMKQGILNKITYPTKGYSEFVYEAHRSKAHGTCGGLRIKEIRNYQPDGVLSERKWYKYGENESGTGVSNTDPDIAHFITETARIVYRQGTDMQYHFKKTYRDTHYQSFPKVSYFASGSSVVYPQVTEYVGDGTQDYGKTVYLYWPNLDQYMPSQGYTYRPGSAEGYLRTYPWRTGALRSKTVYKKDASGYTPIYELSNTYTETNKAEFRNLRVLPYLSQRNEPEGNSSSAPNILRDFCENHSLYGSDYKSPYNYFNYYTTTGLQLISSTTERKDGVTKITSFEYNKYGKPTLITEQSSSGEDDRVTIKKYPADIISSSVYENMTARNIVTPEIEQIVWRGSHFLTSTKAEYSTSKSPNPDLFAPALIKVSNGPDIQDPLARTMQYHRYDTYGNPVYVTAADGTNIVYLWSYEAVYPVIQVQNATYDQVATVLTPVRITSLSANTNPTEQTIKECISLLNAQLPNVLVTAYTYEPMVGVRSITDPSGRTTYYEHDHFGRLAKVADEEGNSLQTYEYNYRK